MLIASWSLAIAGEVHRRDLHAATLPARPRRKSHRRPRLSRCRPSHSRPPSQHQRQTKFQKTRRERDSGGEVYGQRGVPPHPRAPPPCSSRSLHASRGPPVALRDRGRVIFPCASQLEVDGDTPRPLPSDSKRLGTAHHQSVRQMAAPAGHAHEPHREGGHKG
jgi:hypothetical protein